MRGRQRRNSLLQRQIVHCKGEEGEWSYHSRCMPLHCSGTLTHIHECCLQFFSFSLLQIIGIFYWISVGREAIKLLVRCPRWWALLLHVSWQLLCCHIWQGCKSAANIITSFNFMSLLWTQYYTVELHNISKIYRHHNLIIHRTLLYAAWAALLKVSHYLQSLPALFSSPWSPSFVFWWQLSGALLRQSGAFVRQH